MAYFNIVRIRFKAYNTDMKRSHYKWYQSMNEVSYKKEKYYLVNP